MPSHRFSISASVGFEIACAILIAPYPPAARGKVAVARAEVRRRDCRSMVEVGGIQREERRGVVVVGAIEVRKVVRQFELGSFWMSYE
jgi:hypothetical protein